VTAPVEVLRSAAVLLRAPAGDCYPRSGYSPADDMAWIATMDPLVGLALADLLELIADPSTVHVRQRRAA